MSGDVNGQVFLGISAEQLHLINPAMPCNVTHIYASGTLRLPLWHRVAAGIDPAGGIDASRTMPSFLTIVNSTPDKPLEIYQPQRSARASYVDGGGRTHTFEPPPPGPLLGTLRGGLKSSWIQLRFVGDFHREWVPVGIFSEDWEPAEGPTDV